VHLEDRSHDYQDDGDTAVKDLQRLSIRHHFDLRGFGELPAFRAISARRSGVSFASLAAAPFFAIARRFAGESFSARAAPPFFPSSEKCSRKMSSFFGIGQIVPPGRQA
jgi:hypothetical protein